jgi:hypothetical protein
MIVLAGFVADHIVVALYGQHVSLDLMQTLWSERDMGSTVLTAYQDTILKNLALGALLATVFVHAPAARAYGPNQLRYDLRKLKGHGLIERDGSRYAYRLTTKGVQVALLFLFFHKRLCGPIANSRFHHRADPHHRPHSQIEAAYHRADKAIQRIVDVLAAA